MTSGLLAISLQASMHDHPDMRFIEKVIPLYTGQSEIFHILAYRDSSGSNDYANGGMLGGFHITRTSVKDPILMKAGMRKKYARRPESVKGSSTRTEKPQTLNPPDGTDTKKNPKRQQPFRVPFFSENQIFRIVSPCSAEEPSIPARSAAISRFIASVKDKISL